MQYCEEHDLVIDPLHEKCPLCDAEEKREEILKLRAEVKLLRALEAAVIEAVVPATKSRINAIAFYRQWSLGGKIADALEAE